MAAGELFDKVFVMGERQSDVPCRSPNHWESQCAVGSLVIHPVPSDSSPVRTSVVMWVSGMVAESNGLRLFLVEDRCTRDSNVVTEEQVVVPDGTVTTIVILHIVSVALAGDNTSLVSLGESETGLVGTFHPASNPDAVPGSSNGQFPWVRPASINVFGRHLKESLEDLLITHFGSPNGVHNNDALCFTKGVGASTDRSRRHRILARGLGVAVSFGQGSKAHVLVPGSFWSGNPQTASGRGRAWNWFEV